MPISSRRLLCMASILALVPLAGCADHFERRDTIAASTGNAMRANAAIHTIDPWPPSAFGRHQSLDGERALQAVQRYRGIDKTPPAGGSN